MATSDQTKCSTDVTTETRTPCCSLCSEDGEYTAARHYCVDCETYFCRICVKSHFKLPALNSHQVNDVEASAGDGQVKEGREVSSETVMTCTLHDGKVVDTYCKDHKRVCCGTCALITHRLCSTESIAKMADDFKSSPELKQCKEALTQVLARQIQETEKRTELVDNIGKQKIEMIESVDTYEETIIAKVKELANNSRREIRSKYEDSKTDLDCDIATLGAAMSTSMSYIDKLEQTTNEPLLFATATTSKKVIGDAEILLQAMMKEWKDIDFEFHVDRTFEKFIDGKKSLGVLEESRAIKEYKAVFQTNVKVNENTESETSVYGMCLMPTGDLLLTDFDNKKLKRYSSDLQYKDELLLSGSPCAVCKLDNQEVAVRIHDTKVVHIVTTGQPMKLTSSFTLAADGRGMAYDSDTEELFVCEEKRVSVYSTTGNKLRTYEKDINGEQMFSASRQIALSENKQNIWVTDIYRGLIILDKGGHLKTKVTLPGYDRVVPLCLFPGGICLAGCFQSGVFGQVDGDGKLVGTIIDTKNGRSSTYCTLFDRQHSRLIVGGYPSVISVYTISAKLIFGFDGNYIIFVGGV